MWRDDADLFARIRRELFTSVVGDVMDKLGFHHQFLPPRLRPLHPDMVVIGRSMPVLSVDTVQECAIGGTSKFLQKPYGLMLEAVDDLRPLEVYVDTGSSQSALWGEMMTTRALKLGAVGTVLDGYTRDTKAVLNSGFSVFSWGSYGQDSGPRSKVIDFRIPIEIGYVRITPGDILFGDLDGVVAVPKEVEAEVFSTALEKARGEKLVKQALEQGSTAVAAFKKYRIM